jgi:hypothetical protein
MTEERNAFWSTLDILTLMKHAGWDGVLCTEPQGRHYTVFMRDSKNDILLVVTFNAPKYTDHEVTGAIDMAMQPEKPRSVSRSRWISWSKRWDMALQTPSPKVAQKSSKQLT